MAAWVKGAVLGLSAKLAYSRAGEIQGPRAWPKTSREEARAYRRTGAPTRVLTHAGLDPFALHGFVNPPLVRASTVLFENVDAMQGRGGARYSYGLTNTPTIEALVKAFTALEGEACAGTVLVPSGLSAVTTAILSAVRPGKKILVPDNVYSPTRRFCDESLPRFGVTTVYYDPLIGGGIADRLSGASALFLEAPGSHSFEMPDCRRSPRRRARRASPR